MAENCYTKDILYSSHIKNAQQIAMLLIPGKLFPAIQFRDKPKANRQVKISLKYNQDTTHILGKLKAQWNQARRIFFVNYHCTIRFGHISRWVISACRLHSDSNLQRALAWLLQGWFREVSGMRSVILLQLQAREQFLNYLRWSEFAWSKCLLSGGLLRKCWWPINWRKWH